MITSFNFKETSYLDNEYQRKGPLSNTAMGQQSYNGYFILYTRRRWRVMDRDL